MPESYEHEVRVAGGSGHVQNLVFWVFRVMMLIFLIFRAEACMCWSARSRVGRVSRSFKLISVFSDSGIFLLPVKNPVPN